MTNLLQPADVCWFASIKKDYKKCWSDWYMHEEKNFTRAGNTKSPGYLKCCQWLSIIWRDFDSELIKKSFVVCGIQKHRYVNNEVRFSLICIVFVIHLYAIDYRRVEHTSFCP